MVRFVHTADLQIGKPFNWASDQTQSYLHKARAESITTIGKIAADEDADFVLIAGDLFDDNTVGDDVIARTCQRLSEIEVPVYILPGNHDFAGGPSCVYHRDPFLDLKPESVFVLDEPEPHVVGQGGEKALDGEVMILPAPIQRHNEKGDPTDHLTSDFGANASSDAIRVGLAHGGVEDFGAGDAVSRIVPNRAEKANLDYLALGDWHGRKKINPRTWYSGTPEPDSFRQNGQGHTLVVEVGADEDVPEVTAVPTNTHTWLRKEADLQSEEDLKALGRWFEGLDDPLDTLVRLEVNGTLGLDAMSELEDLKERLENMALEVRHRGDVQPKATDEEIKSISSDGYVGDAVEELRSLSEADGDNGDTANRALQLLYQFHRETTP